MRTRWTRLVVAISLFALLAPSPQPARAQLSSCSVGLSPHSVAPDSDTGFSFGFYNGDTDPIQWIEVTRPAGDYVSVQSGSAYSWNAAVGADKVTFTDGSLPHGYSQGFSVDGHARSTPGGPVNWTVKISDDPGGANPVTCSDDLSLSIETQPSIINVSNVRVTSVSNTSVTVLWDTDVASNSKVSYGEDTSYGSSSPTSSSLVTSHSVTLTGLTPNTGYHYMVTSATPADGGTTDSGDNTFLTAITQQQSSGGGSTPVNAPTSNVPGVTIKEIPTEKVPPVITQTTIFNGAYATAPAISGTATDNDAVARVEYSVDGGKNWLPVDHVTSTGRGAKPTSVAFTFTPVIIEDGNYSVVLRATDASSNTAKTNPATLVIDRLPPQVGASLITVGANVTVPTNDGVISSLVGMDHSISMSAVGGPTSVVLHAKPIFGKGKEQSFTLARSADTGLWSGVFSFQQPGAYDVTADAIDGAGNRVQRRLISVDVSLPPTITDKQTHEPVAGAKVTMHALDPSTKRWHIWDGAPYDQENPQVLDKTAAYSYTLPAGKYYLEVKAKGYRTLFSRIFTTERPTPLSSPIELKKINGISIIADRATISTSVPRLITDPIGIKVGESPAAFALQTLTGQTVRSFDLNGKPTVISMLATWHPATSEQLPALAQTQANTDVNVIPVASQERAGKVRVFLGRSGLSLSILADPDGIMIDRLGSAALPKHYFLDRTGVVRKIEVGVLTHDQLMAGLRGL